MQSNFDIAASITLKGEQEFRQSITNATSSLKEVTSESKLVSEQFKGQQNTMEALQAQHEVLIKTVAAHKEKEEALSKALENAKKNQESIGNSLEKLLSQWDEESSKLEQLKKVYGESSDEVKEQEKKLKELTDTIRRGERNYETAGNRVQRWQTKLNSAQVETLRANRALEQNERYLNEAADAADRCATSIDEFGRMVNSSTTTVDNLSKTNDYWKDKFAGAAITKGFSVAVDMLGGVKDKAIETAKYVIEVGSSFEAAMSEVSAISGATGYDLDKLTEKAKELGASTKFSATESAEAFKYMSLAGWSTEQMLSGIEGVMNLAAASGMELAQSSDMVTDYLSAFGMQASESAKLADMLAFAQANSNTSAEQLGEAYGNCAANLNAAGQEIETVTALLESMANQGKKGSEAGTMVSSIMAQITQKMQNGKIAIGDASVAVVKSNGDFRDLIDIINDIDKSLNGMGKAQRSAALSATFNRTALSGLNLIMNEGMDKVNGYKDALDGADGAAANMAATMQDNLQGKITILKSALEGLGISAYEKFSVPMQNGVEEATGIIEELTEKMNNGDLGRAFERLGESLGDSVDILDDVADGLVWIIDHGDMIIATLKGMASGFVMYKAVSGITSVISSIQALSTALKAAESAQTALNLAQMASPVGAVIAGVTALGVALVSLSKSGMRSVKTESEKAAEEIRKLSDRTTDLKNSIEEQKSVQEQEVTSTMAQYAAYQNLSDKVYELNDAIKSGTLTDREANEKKAQMAYYVKQLNEQMPGLNLEIDKQNGLLKQGKKDTDEYITSLKNKAFISAMEEQLTDLYKQQAEAELAGAEATAKKADAEGKAQDVLEKGTAIEAASLEVQELYNKTVFDGEEAQKKYAKAVEDIAKKHGVTTAEISSGAAAMQEASVEAQGYADAAKEAEKAVGAAKEAEEAAITAIEEKTKAYAEYLKEQGYSAEAIANLTGVVLENTDAVNDATEANEEYAESAEDIIASTDAQKEALQSLQEKFEETRSSIRKSMEEKISLYDMFDGGDKISLDEIEKNLNSQIEGLTNWKNNMQKLAGEIGDSMTVELYNKLVELGPSAANIVQEMADALDSGDAEAKLRNIAQKCADALDATDESSQALSATQAVIDTALKKMSDSSEIDFSKLIDSFDGAAEAAAQGGQMISEETRKAFLQTVEAARECGAEIPDGLAESLASGETSVEDAISQLKGSMEGQFQFLSQMLSEAGINVPQSIQDGINQGGEAAVQAMKELQELLVGKQEESRKDFEKTGQQNTQAMGDGVESAKGEVVGKTRNVTQESVAAVNSYKPQFKQAGYDLMTGTAAGIDEGSPIVVEAARKVIRNTKAAANQEADSHSPSRVFRNQVGLYISQGMAAGILDGKKDVISASVELAKSALGATKEELEIHSPSDKFKKQVGRQIASGVAFGIREGKGEAKKSAKELAKEVADAAKSWLEEKKKTGNLTVEEENFMWNRLIRTAGKQGKAYKAQLKKLAKEAKKEIAEESKEYGVSGAALDLYKTFGDVSAKAEIQYWEKVRESKGLTKAQLLEIDKKIIEAQRSYNDQLKDLEDDYLEKCREIRKQLDADRKEAQEEYENTFEERKKTIREAFGLFDEFRSEAESPEKLLANMQSQVMGYTLWMEQLEELEGKGILDGGFIEELRQMGPAAAATIISMNSATDEQIRLMNESYLKKNELSESQAAKETEALRVATEKKIAELEKAAQAEMDKYREEYEKAAAELSAAISKPLEDLAGKATTLGENATTKLILGMTEAAKSKETKAGTGGVKREIVQQMSNLPAKGKIIGKNTLAGILEGLSNKLEIQKGAESFVKELEAAIKKAAGIASPSRRFKEIVGKQIPAGVAAGIEENTQTATDAGTGMIQQMLDQAAEQAKQQQAVLADYAAGLNGSAGIVALNTLVETPAAPAANVTVNNTGVANMIAGLTAEMQVMCDEIRRMKVVLDTGVIAGEIAEPVGDLLSMQTLRWR